MNNNSILVRNIKHLTDARYFAAMEVDWMSLVLSADPLSFSKWHTLRDWVAGVHLVAELGTEDEMLLAKTIIDAKPNGIILYPEVLIDIPQNIQMFYETNIIDIDVISNGGFLILPYDRYHNALHKILELPPDKVFVQSSWSVHELKTLLDAGYKGGICLTGGEEDHTGVRDYGVMDELLELMI